MFDSPKRALPKGRMVALSEPRTCPPTMLRDRTEPSDPVLLPRLMKEVCKNILSLAIYTHKREECVTHEKIVCSDDCC